MSVITEFLTELRKTTESTSFLDSTLGEPMDYISTGSYAINRIISGSFFKGFPSNRVILIGGISQTGKTLLATLTIANAFKENHFDMAFVFDSEAGVSKQLFASLGVPLDKVEYVVVRSVEDCATKILKMYDIIAKIKKENPEFKCIAMLDSLGALITRKTFVDMSASDQKVDQGLRARMVNDFSNSVCIPALETNCSLIVLNHVYEGPGEKYPAKIRPQSGGKGIQYVNRLALQCTRSMDRNVDKEAEDVYQKTKLKFFTIKNGAIVPFLETEVELDFKKGFVSPYTGLLSLAIKYGFVKEVTSQSVIIPSYEKGKKVKNKNLMYSDKSDEIWKTFIKELDEKQSKEIQYSSFLDDTPIAAASLGEEGKEEQDDRHDQSTTGSITAKGNIELI